MLKATTFWMLKGYWAIECSICSKDTRIDLKCINFHPTHQGCRHHLYEPLKLGSSDKGWGKGSENKIICMAKCYCKFANLQLISIFFFYRLILLIYLKPSLDQAWVGSLVWTKLDSEHGGVLLSLKVKIYGESRF